MFNTTIDFTPLLVAVFSTVGLVVLRGLGHFAVNEAVKLLTPYVGEKEALVVQQRVNELLDKGVSYAMLEGKALIEQHGLTVDVQNWLAARVAQYAVDHAPDLAVKAGGLADKGLARLLPHPEVKAAVAAHASANDNAPQDIRPAAQAA